MQKTKKPTIGGVLNIIGGVLFIVAEIFILLLGWGEIPLLGIAILAAFLFISGILTIVGGIFALKRKRWRLSLAGSIGGTIGAVFIVYVLLGIPILALINVPALLLIIISKNEFK